VSSAKISELSGWRGGFQVGASLATGAFALAVSFGAFATLHGWPPLAVIAMSVVVFSGSAQFALVTSMAGGGGLTTGLTAAALINTRFIPMAAATASSLRGSRLRRAVEGQAVVDGSWVSAQRPEGGVDREKMIGATLVQWPAWILGTAIGAIFVPSTEFIHAAGLDLIFPCFFLLLLLDALHSRPDHRLVAAAAVVIAAGASAVLPPGVALLLCGVAAALTNVQLGWRRS
jgi:predicted branched-subunit amino acid permease